MRICLLYLTFIKAHIFYASIGEKIFKLTSLYLIFCYTLCHTEVQLCVLAVCGDASSHLNCWTFLSSLHMKCYRCASCFINFCTLFLMACNMYHLKCQSSPWFFLCWFVLCTFNSSKASRFICPDAFLVLVVGVVDNACKLLSLQFIT